MEIFWAGPTPWDARVFNPGQGPRISPGRKGFHGWSLSLTSFADVLFKGPGGGSAWRTWSPEIIRSRSSIERPASDPYAGKPVTTETKVIAEKPRKYMGFIVIIVDDALSQRTRPLYCFHNSLPRFGVIETTCGSRLANSEHDLGPLFQSSFENDHDGHYLARPSAKTSLDVYHMAVDLEQLE